MTLLLTVNKKHIFNATCINVISKVIISKVFISIVVVSAYWVFTYFFFFFVTGQAVGLRPDAESSKETGQRNLPLNWTNILSKPTRDGKFKLRCYETFSTLNKVLSFKSACTPRQLSIRPLGQCTQAFHAKFKWTLYRIKFLIDYWYSLLWNILYLKQGTLF